MTHILTDGRSVTDPGGWLRCSCPTFAANSRRLRATGLSVGWCPHVVHVMTERLDTIGPHTALDVLLFTKEHPLSLPVVIGNDDNSGLRAVSFWHKGEQRIVGYVTAQSPRMAIRELLLPYLVDTYFTMVCPKCNAPRTVTRAMLNDYRSQGEAAYRAGYLLKRGSCPDCDFSDLIPNTNPNPPGGPND